jgi:hypothetical protein
MRQTLAAIAAVVLLAAAGYQDPPLTPSDRQHWAYVPPERPPFPSVTNAAWVRNSIDRFVLAKLDAAKLAPGAEADRATLIRRLTFDLTGLPPTPAEVAAFLADESPCSRRRSSGSGLRNSGST